MNKYSCKVYVKDYCGRITSPQFHWTNKTDVLLKLELDLECQLFNPGNRKTERIVNNDNVIITFESLYQLTEYIIPNTAY